MKIINVFLPSNWRAVDIKRGSITVLVETDDEYLYKVSVATPEHLQFVMDNEKSDCYGPSSPFIIVNKLTPEIIEQAIKDFAEDENNGYWLKVYHFGGSIGIIDENTFDRLKSKRIDRLEKLDELDELDEVELDGLLDDFNE